MLELVLKEWNERSWISSELVLSNPGILLKVRHPGTEVMGHVAWNRLVDGVLSVVIGVGAVTASLVSVVTASLVSVITFGLVIRRDSLLSNETGEVPRVLEGLTSTVSVEPLHVRDRSLATMLPVQTASLININDSKVD